MQESEEWLEAPQQVCAAAWADESDPALPLVLDEMLHAQPILTG